VSFLPFLPVDIAFSVVSHDSMRHGHRWCKSCTRTTWIQSESREGTANESGWPSIIIVSYVVFLSLIILVPMDIRSYILSVIVVIIFLLVIILIFITIYYYVTMPQTMQTRWLSLFYRVCIVLTTNNHSVLPLISMDYCHYNTSPWPLLRYITLI